MKSVVPAICILLALLAGCGKSETPAPQREASQQTLLIGLIPERNIFRQMERYEPIADYLSQKAGVKIELKVLTRYGNIVDNFVAENLDGAFFGSFTYTLAHTKLGIDVLARPLSAAGVSTYHGLILVRRDSGIKGIRNMKGKRFAFVDKATTAGYLLPRAYFSEHGVKDYKTYFKETYFTGTHEDAIYDVLNRKADICAAKNTVFESLALTDKRIKNELIVLAISPDVPENALAVRKDLAAELKAKLKEALIGMYLDPDGKTILEKFGAQKFIETTDNDYEPVYRYAREINLDLKAYDYMNR